MNPLSPVITSTTRLCDNSFIKEIFPGRFFASYLFYLTFIILLSAVTSNTSAQVKPKRVVGSFIYEGNAYNYEFNKIEINSYSFLVTSLGKVDAKPDSDATTETDTLQTVSDTDINSTNTSNISSENKPEKAIGVSSNPDVFDEFTRTSFDTVFKKQMISRDTITNSKQSLENLSKKGAELFFSIQSKLEFLDDEPVTAHMILKKNIVNSILISNASNYYDATLSYPVAWHKVKSVDVETDDGTIKNIIVRVIDPKNTSPKSRGSLEFKNTTPISISGKHDPEHLSEVKLYCLNCGGINGLNRYILFSNLLQLDITLENDKEDYSPANKTFSLTPQASIVELKKEKRSQILSVAAFSDFVGLDQEQPNGLLQIEAKRKININTKYSPTSSFWSFTDWIFNPKRKEETDEKISKYDFGTYGFKRIEPTVKQLKSNTDTITKYKVMLKKAWLVNDNAHDSTITFFDFESAKRFVRKNPSNALDNDKWLIKQKQRRFFQDSASAIKYIKENPGTQIEQNSVEWLIRTNKNDRIIFTDSISAAKHLKDHPSGQLFKKSKGNWLVIINQILHFQNSESIVKYVKENPSCVIKETRNVPVDTIEVAKKRYPSGYYTWMSSIEPKLLFSKLDGNNKFLVLDSAFSSRKGINPLKQYQYQLASFGFTANIIKFSYPQSKLTWNFLDIGTYWYRTRVQSIKDTATKNSVAINNGYLSLGMQVGFKPDSRYGANIGVAYIFQKAFNNDYKFEKNNGLGQANFDAFIKTNEDSKLFFRFRWIYDWHTFNNNFTQIQLGYSVNIFANSGSSK
ncbi:hypothetical protein MTO98_05280 [Mucilaginibacter sp. SMC90]|uniref:hypothetical protein n=1 Tax=Mucilaginibacter sp. SMC90 TaxID=2929803 RepID=UPI001FB4D93E|nr:hypothetical protein [Mucilaginibacter sp. SMC90]UOE50485.1 hypothetical protein MTO98_05280 [Mucilaginibacter sp. SMC90]